MGVCIPIGGIIAILVGSLLMSPNEPEIAPAKTDGGIAEEILSEREDEEIQPSEEETDIQEDEYVQEDECESVVWAYVFDEDSTNIRDKMKGKVILKIGGTPTLGLSSPIKGWWKIEDSGTLGNEVLNGSTTGYWIHSSVVRTRLVSANGEEISMKASPADDAEEVFSLSPNTPLIPVDEKNCWVNLKTEDGIYSGWVKKDNISRNEEE